MSLHTRRKRWKVYALEEGDAILLPPNTRFHGSGLTPETFIWVLHFEQPGTLKCVRHIHRAAGDAFGRGLLSEISREYHESPVPETAAYLSALADTLIKKLMRTTSPQGSLPRDSRLKWYRVDDLNSPSGWKVPKVSDLADDAGLSPSRHRELFVRQFGVTPRQHLKQLRMVLARMLLRETSLPVKQIAESAGYTEVASFHRAFAGICGCTPGEFRTKHPPIE